MNEAQIKENLIALLKNYRNAAHYQVDVMNKKIDVPVEYSDVGALMAFFPVSYKKTAELLQSARIKPVSILGGRCLLGITIFDYRNSPVGPYRELALSIPVTMDSKISIPFLPLIFESFFSTFGFYTILLAMNTDIARKHSEEIFGYPTFAKNINIIIEEDNGLISILANDAEEKIFALSMKKPHKFGFAQKGYTTYFTKNDGIMRVEMQTAAFVGQSTRQEYPLLNLGNHKISQIIKELSPSPRAARSMYYAHAIEILNAPHGLGGL